VVTTWTGLSGVKEEPVVTPSTALSGAGEEEEEPVVTIWTGLSGGEEEPVVTTWTAGAVVTWRINARAEEEPEVVLITWNCSAT
jgi:hypothetical protein